MAVGTYASLAGVKSRMGITDTTDDAVLTTLCAQVNDFVETYCQRPIAPVPTYTSGLGAAASAGDSTVTVGDSTGLSSGDALAFGPVTGTHESASVLTVSANTVTLATALAYAYGSNAPVERVYIFDGYDAAESGKCLPIEIGVQYVKALEVNTFSAGAGGSQGTSINFYRLPATDYHLEPQPSKRPAPYWPATQLWITDVPQPGNSAPSFFPGFANTRVWGALGFPSTPDDVVGVGLNLAVAAYRARGAGGGETFTVESDGSRPFERLLSVFDRSILMEYKAASLGSFIV